MPVREQVTSQIVLVAGINLALDGNETNAGVIVDTANFDLGIYFFLLLTAWTDGAHALIIEEGDDSGLSDAAVVGAEKLVGSLPSSGAINANGDIAECVGVHSTKRYVRASVVSTGVSTGAVGTILCVKGAENLRSASTAGFDV